MDKPKKGGAGLGQGRKPKSGKYIQFRPSVKVWDILKDKPNKTAFIEESVLKWEGHNKAIELLNKD